MKIYNTLTNSIQEFIPLKENEVKMYVCGPTVYNYIHIGNTRPIIVFDVLARLLTYKGYKVTYVQNFTDIDDKIIKKANEEKISCQEITKKYIKEIPKLPKSIKGTAYSVQVKNGDIVVTPTVEQDD